MPSQYRSLVEESRFTKEAKTLRGPGGAKKIDAVLAQLGSLLPCYPELAGEKVQGTADIFTLHVELFINTPVIIYYAFDNDKVYLLSIKKV